MPIRCSHKPLNRFTTMACCPMKSHLKHRLTHRFWPFRRQTVQCWYFQSYWDVFNGPCGNRTDQMPKLSRFNILGFVRVPSICFDHRTQKNFLQYIFSKIINCMVKTIVRISRIFTSHSNNLVFSNWIKYEWKINLIAYFRSNINNIGYYHSNGEVME